MKKTDPRLTSYADVDEANSAVGVAIALGALPEDIATLLRRIQNDLFDVGADLCTPVDPDPKYPPLRSSQDRVDAVEREIDRFNEHLEALRSLRAMRAHRERHSCTSHAPSCDVQGGPPGPPSRGAPRLDDELTAKYLNRASDLLFVLARYANRERGDVLAYGSQAPTADPPAALTSGTRRSGVRVAPTPSRREPRERLRAQCELRPYRGVDIA